VAVSVDFFFLLLSEVLTAFPVSNGPPENRGFFRMPDALPDRFCFLMELGVPESTEDMERLEDETVWKVGREGDPVELLSSLLLAAKRSRYSARRSGMIRHL
jgi:hypothetical protein